jgi:hypothetical protein
VSMICWVPSKLLVVDAVPTMLGLVFVFVDESDYRTVMQKSGDRSVRKGDGSEDVTSKEGMMRTQGEMSIAMVALPLLV